MATASLMCASQRSRSTVPIVKRRWRWRSRGWPRSIGVVVGTAPVLHEEQREAVTGAGEVGPLRVQRSEDFVAGDPVVERVDEALEEVAPADAFVQCRRRVIARNGSDNVHRSSG